MSSNTISEQSQDTGFNDREFNTEMLKQNFRRLQNASTTNQKREIYEEIAHIFHRIEQWNLALKYYRKIYDIFDIQRRNEEKESVLYIIELIQHQRDGSFLV